MPESSSPMRLCIFCRRLEQASEPCPQVVLARQKGLPTHLIATTPLQGASPLCDDDAKLLGSLQKQPSSLCQRCSDYDIGAVFKNANPLDSIQRHGGGEGDDSDPRRQLSGQEMMQRHRREEDITRQLSRYEMPLGVPSEVQLTPACPPCRLIYRILPRGQSLDPADATPLKITPVRQYERSAGWEAVPSELKSRYSIRLGLYEFRNDLARKWFSLNPGGSQIELPIMNGEVIAMETGQTPPDRRGHNARWIDHNLMDLGWLKEKLYACESSHGDSCRGAGVWPAEMSKTRMVDVLQRKAVPCPDNCDYVALSYVVGGVVPAARTLQSGTLPRTLEDAITLTRGIGKRYLWNPRTRAQRREKQEQLGLMHLIYSSASLVVIAISGVNTDSGLPDISPSRPRYPQIRETISGHNFFSVPPPIFAGGFVWDSRAWTLQERIFARRTLTVGSHQTSFDCGRLGSWESEDTDTIVDNGETPPTSSEPAGSASTSSLWSLVDRGISPGGGAQARTTTSAQAQGHLAVFGFLLTAYTSRKMTDESDSINAFLGILAALQKQLLPLGFVFGLPLQSRPETLAWLHHSGGCVPKRRPAFPSWSWAGWEGEARFPRPKVALLDDQPPDDGDLADLKVGFVSAAATGGEIVLEGWIMDLHIRSEPYSEVLEGPGGDVSVGTVKERDFHYNDTLPSGVYICLIIQGVLVDKGSPRVLLVHLDWVVPGRRLAERKTLLTVTPWSGHLERFLRLERKREVVRLV